MDGDTLICTVDKKIWPIAMTLKNVCHWFENWFVISLLKNQLLNKSWEEILQSIFAFVSISNSQYYKLWNKNGTLLQFHWGNQFAV